MGSRGTGGRGKGKSEHLFTPEELEAKLGEYLDKCREEGKRPTRPGIRLALNISEDTLLRYEGGEGNYGELARPLKRAMDRIQDELEQGKDSMNIFLLKQPCYGGYADKPANDWDRTVNVNISFGGESGGNYGK